MVSASSHVGIVTLAPGVIGLRVASDELPHLDFATVAAIDVAVNDIASRPHDEVRAVVLLGGRRHFTSGAPRSLLTATDAPDAVPRLIRAAPSALFRLPVPSIAAMRGHAIGGGLMFGLWCDVAVLAKTSLYAANFVALGFTPGMGASRRLSELFGPWLAQKMLLTGLRFTGAELVEANPALAMNVVAADQVEAHAIALAEAIALADPVALRAFTALQHLRMKHVFEAALADEEPLQTALLAEPATRAAIARAYAEPRRVDEEEL